LTRFKDALHDPDQPQLEDAVQEVLRPILEKCHSAQMEVRVEEMTELLNELLPTEIRAARPPQRKRSKTEKPKKKKEAHSQHGETDADPTPHGPARTPRTPFGTLTIAFDGPLCD